MNEPINAQEALETVLYKFLNLHDAIEKQRLVLERQNEDLAAMTEELGQLVQQHQQLDNAIRHQIAASIQSATRNLQTEMGNEARKAMFTAVNEITHPLNFTAEKTRQALEEVQYDEQYRFWKQLIITFGGAIIASLASVWLLLPKATLPLTDQQLETYQLGNSFSQLLTQLGPKEQQAVWDILRQKKPKKTKKQQEDDGVEGWPDESQY